MIRLFLAAPLAIGLGLALPAAPAAAQDNPGDLVNMVIIYGDDECPRSRPDEIVVCQRLDEEERFRIPEILRGSDSPQNEAWSRRVRSLETVGNFGTLACTPSGAGGALGCTQQIINAAFEERRTGADVRFSQLIEQERQERLATIDEEAAAEQARVEQIEREYMERLERERSGELPGEAGPLPAPQPHLVDGPAAD